MIIEDGHGTGNKAKIDSNGDVHVKAISIPFEQDINKNDEEAYSVIIEKTPTGAGDCFGYIKNTSDKDLYVTSLIASAATDETIRVKVNDVGTPVGTTANVPVNKKAGSSNEVGATVYDGVDITGLSGGSIVEQLVIDGATGSMEFKFDSAIIIPKNQVLTLYAVTGAIALVVSLGIIFKE